MTATATTSLEQKTQRADNVGGWVSRVKIDEPQAREREQETIIWGEEKTGSPKPNVDRHVQIQATVSTPPSLQR